MAQSSSIQYATNSYANASNANVYAPTKTTLPTSIGAVQASPSDTYGSNKKQQTDGLTDTERKQLDTLFVSLADNNQHLQDNQYRGQDASSIAKQQKELQEKLKDSLASLSASQINAYTSGLNDRLKDRFSTEQAPSNTLQTATTAPNTITATDTQTQTDTANPVTAQETTEQLISRVRQNQDLRADGQQPTQRDRTPNPSNLISNTNTPAQQAAVRETTDQLLGRVRSNNQQRATSGLDIQNRLDNRNTLDTQNTLSPAAKATEYANIAQRFIAEQEAQKNLQYGSNGTVLANNYVNTQSAISIFA